MSEVAKHDSGVLPRMGKLGEEDWERMRSEISGLYPKTTLNEMKEVIQQLHGFTSSDKQWKKHLKDWGLKKYNMQSDIKDKLQRLKDGDESILKDYALVRSLSRRQRMSKPGQSRPVKERQASIPHHVARDRQQKHITQGPSLTRDKENPDRPPMFEQVTEMPCTDTMFMQNSPLRALPSESPSTPLSLQNPLVPPFIIRSKPAYTQYTSHEHISDQTQSTQHHLQQYQSAANSSLESCFLKGPTKQSQTSQSLFSSSLRPTQVDLLRKQSPSPSIAYPRPKIEYWATSPGKQQEIAALCRVIQTIDQFKSKGMPYPQLALGPERHNLCTEAIKHEIGMYCKRAQHSLINTPYSFIYQGKTQVREPGPAVQFWLAIKHGIYLCKKSKLEHGAEALREAYMLAQASCALGIRALDSIRELLTTLSPVNTSVWPDVRIQMLNLLHELMTSDLGSENTLTRITYQLLHDGGDRNVSENALLCLINECTRLLGQQHVATVRARLSLVKLLRRSHDYYRAACEDVELLSFCVEQTSSDSVWSRECARMLTHVFMALGHRDQAIDLEKDIVGMRISSTGTIDVMHHDECAIYTMEDLAENYDEKGDFEACATWLKLAVQNAQNLWTNQWMATQHLVEKLERALKACGKAEEIHIWKNKYARPSD